MIARAAIKRQLEQSLATTPARATWTMRHVRIANDMEGIVARALDALKARNWQDFHYYLDWAARLFVGIAEPEDYAMSRATVAESDTKTLVREVLARAEAGEKDARAALLAAARKLSSPKSKEKTRGRA